MSANVQLGESMIKNIFKLSLIISVSLFLVNCSDNSFGGESEQLASSLDSTDESTSLDTVADNSSESMEFPMILGKIHYETYQHKTTLKQFSIRNDMPSEKPNAEVRIGSCYVSGNLSEKDFLILADMISSPIKVNPTLTQAHLSSAEIYLSTLEGKHFRVNLYDDDVEKSKKIEEKVNSLVEMLLKGSECELNRPY